MPRAPHTRVQPRQRGYGSAAYRPAALLQQPRASPARSIFGLDFAGLGVRLCQCLVTVRHTRASGLLLNLRAPD